MCFSFFLNILINIYKAAKVEKAPIITKIICITISSLAILVPTSDRNLIYIRYIAKKQNIIIENSRYDSKTKVSVKIHTHFNILSNIIYH